MSHERVLFIMGNYSVSGKTLFIFKQGLGLLHRWGMVVPRVHTSNHERSIDIHVHVRVNLDIFLQMRWMVCTSTYWELSDHFSSKEPRLDMKQSSSNREHPVLKYLVHVSVHSHWSAKPCCMGPTLMAEQNDHHLIWALSFKFQWSVFLWGQLITAWLAFVQIIACRRTITWTNAKSHDAKWRHQVPIVK